MHNLLSLTLSLLLRGYCGKTPIFAQNVISRILLWGIYTRSERYVRGKETYLSCLNSLSRDQTYNIAWSAERVSSFHICSWSVRPQCERVLEDTLICRIQTTWVQFLQLIHYILERRIKRKHKFSFAYKSASIWLYKCSSVRFGTEKCLMNVYLIAQKIKNSTWQGHSCDQLKFQETCMQKDVKATYELADERRWSAFDKHDHNPSRATRSGSIG